MVMIFTHCGSGSFTADSRRTSSWEAYGAKLTFLRTGPVTLISLATRITDTNTLLEVGP